MLPAGGQRLHLSADGTTSSVVYVWALEGLHCSNLAISPAACINFMLHIHTGYELHQLHAAHKHWIRADKLTLGINNFELPTTYTRVAGCFAASRLWWHAPAVDWQEARSS